MGSHDLLSEHLKDEVARRNSRVLVVAAERHIEALRGADGYQDIPGLRLQPLPTDAPIPQRVLAEASLLVVEVEPASPASMRRLGELRNARPDLPVVAAISGASVSLVRTLVRGGISDVVSLPIDFNEMLQVSLDAAAKFEAGRATQVSLAPMIAVVRSTGGCGATTVATHLAAALGNSGDATRGKGAVIVDLDLQFGAASAFLAVKSKSDISALLDAGDRLDEELLASVAVEVREGLSVIPAPTSILPLEAVDTDQMLRTLQLLRRHYGVVVLDLPANWTNWTLSAAAVADVVLMVVDLSIASLRQARRRIELFRSVGIEGDMVQIVINRLEKKLFRTITLNDVSTTLDHDILGSLPQEATVIPQAQDRGQLAGEFARKSKFAAAIATLVEALQVRRPGRNK